jgi:hypothetical protein
LATLLDAVEIPTLMEPSQPGVLSYIIKTVDNPADRVWGHFTYYPELEETGRIILFLMRDPRDIIVAIAHWAVNERHRTMIDYFVRDNLRLSQIPFSSRIDWLIENMNQYLVRYNGWLDCAEVFRFEDLVTLDINNLCELVGDDPEKMLERYTKDTNSFRKGLVGEWKHEFTEKQKKRANVALAEVLEAWGY